MKSIKKKLWNDLKLSELQLICEISSHPSLRSLAKSQNQSPQNMSKILVQMERKLGFQLIHRSTFGYQPTDRAMKLIDSIRERVEDLIKMDLTDSVSDDIRHEYTICARVFSNFCLSPILVQAFSISYPDVRFRFVDGSPQKKEEWSRLGLVDVFISVGKLSLGKEWYGEIIGEMKWNFYCKLNHPLGEATNEKNLLKFPIILHSHIGVNRLIENKSVGPMKLKPAILGASTETNLAALQIASKTNQICFVPDLIVQFLQLQYQVQKLRITDLDWAAEPIYVYSHTSRVKNHHLQSIIKNLRLNLF